MSTPVASAGVALLAAVISALGALYVGKRSRDTSRHVAEFQKELADTVLRRELCLTLGSRALLVGERAAEIQGAFASFERLPSNERKDEKRRRMDRLDHACDRFVESWTDVASWNLGSTRLALLVNELSNALEAAKLLVIIPQAEAARQSLSLREVDRIARSIHGLCVEMARDFALPIV